MTTAKNKLLQILYELNTMHEPISKQLPEELNFKQKYYILSKTQNYLREYLKAAPLIQVKNKNKLIPILKQNTYDKANTLAIKQLVSYNHKYISNVNEAFSRTIKAQNEDSKEDNMLIFKRMISEDKKFKKLSYYQQNYVDSNESDVIEEEDDDNSNSNEEDEEEEENSNEEDEISNEEGKRN